MGKIYRIMRGVASLADVLSFEEAISVEKVLRATRPESAISDLEKIGGDFQRATQSVTQQVREEKSGADHSQATTATR